MSGQLKELARPRFLAALFLPLGLYVVLRLVTGAFGIALLASLALGRPLLVVIAERRAELDPESRAEIESRLATPVYRRALVTMTLLLGLAMLLDGAIQTTLALSLSTTAFVAASTVAHVVVLGGGAASLFCYFRFRYQRQRRLEVGR